MSGAQAGCVFLPLLVSAHAWPLPALCCALLCSLRFISFQGLDKISLSAAHLYCTTACLVAAVLAAQLTTEGSEPQTAGLPLASPASSDLCLKVSILHFVSLRENGEQGKSHHKIHRTGKSWQRVSPTTVTSTQPWARCFTGGISIKWEVRQVVHMFRQRA